MDSEDILLNNTICVRIMNRFYENISTDLS